MSRPSHRPTSAELQRFRDWLAHHPEGPAPAHRRPYPEWMLGPRWADALHGGAYIRALLMDERGAGFRDTTARRRLERQRGAPFSWRRP